MFIHSGLWNKCNTKRLIPSAAQNRNRKKGGGVMQKVITGNKDVKEMNINNMTHTHLWPLELQLPPAHPPATHKMASTLSSPSNWDTSDVTCTKRKMTLKIFLSRKKDFKKWICESTTWLMQDWKHQLNRLPLLQMRWCFICANGLFNRNLNTQICCYFTM